MKARGWPSCFMLAVIQAIAGSSSLAGLGAIAGSSVKASSNSPSVLVFNEEDKLTIRNDDSIYVVEVSALTDSLAVSLLPADALPKYQGKPFQRYPAVFGFYRLPLGHYVALVKKSTPIEGLSSIGAVQKVEQVVLLQIPGSAAAAANQSLADEHNRQLKELEKAFKRHQFIFSSGSYDVLCSLQANAQGLGSSERFNWNKLAIQPLASAAGCNKLVTRFVNAMVSSMEFVLHGKRFVLTLIARRSKEQQGHRYIKRGSNDAGEVANFVEIEQILQMVDNDSSVQHVSSFVQVRGSIPLHWSQPHTWRMKPGIVLDSSATQDLHNASVQTHFKQLAASYELGMSGHAMDLFVVNLIDKHGGQGRLGRLWHSVLLNLSDSSNKTVPDSLTDRSKITVQDLVMPLSDSLDSPQSLGLRYIWLDYHYRSKHGSVSDALHEVYRSLQPALQTDDGALFVGARRFGEGWSLRRKQTSLVRTNCVDCLDRTNVVQTAVSRWVLMRQISALCPDLQRKFPRSSRASLSLAVPEVEKAFRRMWTELGDHLSVLYAGSRAMKRDVTMSGNRTKIGAVSDAVSYLQRYYANNYKDRQKQAALDAMLVLDHHSKVGCARIPQLQQEGDVLLRLDEKCTKNGDVQEEVSGAVSSSGSAFSGYRQSLDNFFAAALKELALDALDIADMEWVD